MTPESTVSLALIFGIISAVGVVFNMVRSYRESLSGIIKANVKLDELCGKVDEQRLDVRAIDQKINNMGKKQLEHDIRMDGIEERLSRLEERND